MYSTHNEGKSIIFKRFIRTLNKEIYKYMTSVSKNVYIDRLDNIVDKYNNRYQSAIKMKPVDVKSSTYIDSSKESNNKDHKFKIGDIIRILKYKNNFTKGYISTWSEDVFVIKKVKNILPWTYVNYHINEEEILVRFTKTNCQKQIKKNL